MKCECGGEFEPYTENVEGIPLDCLKCNRCEKILYTSEQMKDFIGMKTMMKKTTTKRKIIVLGHSYAITLPKSLEEIGLKAGQRVSMKMTGKKTLEVKFGEESERITKENVKGDD
ncbi:MAG: hypothetical protein GW779_04695 [Candidatus Altiarchaeum hamiconexum]|uniref:SpoVT-AbrB domain-containing protein n=1 Tax=Candidatus Altarchaeum hamiconexum TaxID=1803513 RepID=A0A8J7YV25_9ARCH|nr:hypothetical protein [Candidatus Altarchaeum hamiconexum]OIQ04705.1 MAG: hypothetical protein AUK59_06690 [Candidatus Altarchaeum sp. CG2_30_32_3053]PIN67223.1 MAG: hypothetical protein COV98_04030 [Candidatus Altarchaeum sp. CG12_big_fil_rev_8_21_14_0_65_33_22]PIV28338.1 MAG: hypothetical protein COS36_02565 [Candidatus Altarchaeum sp. CG03_land_8_20_14_0_80_32_618]PIX48732.1 MAG: hypothetical protein COZ53_03060 [Candidatus Altarchaeum sp. CG_4_8_14_3_um_filter_33_2054]PIZ32621.1 MAG: hyp